MDDPIVNRALPEEQPDLGPWSPAALARRALADLATIAEAMRQRRLSPPQILDALWRQSEQWRQYGAALPANAALSVLRQLPGLRFFDAFDDWRSRYFAVDPQVDGIDASGGDDERREWWRRAKALEDWLERYGGTWCAETAVRAVEREFAIRTLEDTENAGDPDRQARSI